MDTKCIECGRSFPFQDDEAEFLRRMQFRFGTLTADIPAPRQCPECRLQIRTAHRNEQHMYPGTSALSGKRMISLYAPEPPWGEPYKVYLGDDWHSDGWDPLDFGREFDFNRPFFDQFKELQKAVPRLGLVAYNNENCPFTTGTAYCKDCHLISCSENSQNCYYGKLYQGCRDCMDCSYVYNSELCYGSFSIYDCYGCQYLSYGKNCADCWFSENLIGCHHCLFCTNLRNQDYCVSNNRVTPEAFEKALNAIRGSFREYQKALAAWEKLRRQRVHKHANIVNAENCSGDFITNCHNCRDCYDMNDSEDCRYVCVGVNVRDMYDCSNVYLKQELNYQILGSIAAYHCAFSIYVFHSRDILYSDHIWNGRDLFGCTGLRKHHHCILNRQYSESEYRQLVPRIIEHMRRTGEWGLFFPPAASPFCYNESLAFDYAPLSKEQVLAKGWNWRDEKRNAAPSGTGFALPDLIENAGDELCEEILTCEASGRPYKILPIELAYYRSHRIPVPRRAPLQRHFDREKLRNGRHIFERFCEQCGAKILTNFDPESPEMVYCAACYDRAIEL